MATTSARTPMRFGGASSALGSGSSAVSSSAVAGATASSTPRRATPKAKLNLNLNFSAVKAATPRAGSARKPLRVVSTANTNAGSVDVTKILQGVYAMVDVRLGADAEIDCSDAVAKKLAGMGATILKKKSGRLTHVVVSHFTPQWKEKVGKWHSFSTPLEVVSQLWVNACFTNKQRMKESAFFPVNIGFETSVLTPARSTLTGGALRVARTTTKKELTTSGRKRAPPSTPARSSTLLASLASGGARSATATPLRLSNSVISSTPTSSRTAAAATRKRRALSMEPMASDAILRLLENSTKKLLRQNSESDVHAARAAVALDSAASTPVKISARESKTSTPPLTVRLKAAIERRKSFVSSTSVASNLGQLQRVDITSRTPANDCVSESCSEDADDERKNASSEFSSGETTMVSSGTVASSVESTAAQSSQSSLNVQSPAPMKGEWACSICSCVNARTRRLCKGCKASRVAAKTSVTDKTPAKQPTLRSASTTPRRRALSAKAVLAGITGTPAARTPNTRSTRKTPATSSKAPQPLKRPRLSSSADTESSSIRSSNDLFSDERLGASTPAAKKQKLTPTTTVKKPVSQRAVIGITGVDSETRGIIECAVHGIDANMSSEPGHRKARVVKSIDYAAGVTHLIVGHEIKRTIKVLFAIARGAWIVSEAWAFSSLEQEQWLNEEAFEVLTFPTRASRMLPEQRLVFRSLKFFVGSKIDPSREVLISLIQCAGGEIVNQISVADYCICGDETLFRRAARTKIYGVTPKWVFDSIAKLKLEDASEYGLSGEVKRDQAADGE